MIARIRGLLYFATLALALPAFGQSVQQSGNVTPGHVTQWITDGVVGDGGPLGGGATLNGMFNAFDFLCANSLSNTPLVIDCGLSATGPNTWNGIQTFAAVTNLSGGATSLTRPPGDNTTSLATTAFVHTAINGFVPIVPTNSPYNCVGNGIADDTACMQSALNASVAAGVPLLVGWNNTKYLITSPLSTTGVVDIEGFAPVGNDGVADAQTCLNGFTVGSNNIDLLRLNGPKSIVRNVCMQMGSTSNRRSAGIAIALGGTDQGHSEIIGNTIFWPYDGIHVGRGSSDLVRASNISNNVIRSPVHGITIGQGTINGVTAGITMIDNQIGCDSGVTGVGLQIFDGAVLVDGTTNGPNNCTYGTAIIPGNSQNVNGEFRGVMGDANTVNDLVIAPTESGGITFGGTVNFLDFTQAWASAVGNNTSILINCPANTLCEEIRFNSLTAHGGLNQTAPIVDIERGAGGPINLQISNSTICSFRTAGGGEIALKLNVTVSQPAHWLITNNKIGQACDGGGGGSPTPIGISLATVGGGGYFVITGNDLSFPATPISYTPNSEIAIINNNLGAMNWYYTIAQLPACAAATSGLKAFVTNGETTPTFLAAVSTTGAVIAPVLCNGTAWVYG